MIQLANERHLDEFHQNNIAVHTDYQSRHIGRLLIKHVSAHLQNQEICRIYLEVSEGCSCTTFI